MSAPSEELAQKLRLGGWRRVSHVDGKDFAICVYRSAVDPRVQMVSRHQYRPRMADARITRQFSFGDRSVDVSVVPGGPIVEEADARTFATLDECAECVLAHDRELTRAREWEAAAP